MSEGRRCLMSEDMEELERWEPRLTCVDLEEGPATKATMEAMPSGEWVRFSDVEEREARLKARIEELEVIVSGKTMYDAAAVADARWREHIEGAIEVELERYKREIETSEMWPANDPNFDWEHVRVPHLRSAGDAISRVYALRSLLDSGEQKECPACDGYGWVSCVTGKGADPKGAVDSLDGCPFCTKPGECGGSGHRATTPSPALEECTNCDGTGTRFSEVAWDDLTCGRCNGNKAVPAGSQEGKFGGPGGRRPSPSPALHREGREQFCPEKTQKNWTTDGGSAIERGAAGQSGS